MEQIQQTADVQDDRFNLANHIGIYTKNQDIIDQYIGPTAYSSDDRQQHVVFRLYFDRRGSTIVYTLPVLKGFRYDTGVSDESDVNSSLVLSELVAYCREKKVDLADGEWLFKVPEEVIVETDDYFVDEHEVPAEFLIRAVSGEYLSACETYSALTMIWDNGNDCYELGPQHWKKDMEVPYIEIDDEVSIRFEFVREPWVCYRYLLWDKAEVFAGLKEAKEKTDLFYSKLPEPFKVEVLELDKPTRSGAIFTTEEVQRAVNAFDARVISPGDTSYYGRHITKPFQNANEAGDVGEDNATHSVTAMTIEDGKLWATIEIWPNLKSRKVYELYEKNLGAFRVCYSAEMFKVEDDILATNMTILAVDFIDTALL